MTHGHSNQDPRKSKSKEGSGRQISRSQTASSSQREHRSGSSSHRTSTSQPSGSSSSPGRRHSGHGSAGGYSETYPRAGPYTVPSPMDLASMNAEQGSRGSYVDETRAATVGYESWEQEMNAAGHPGVAFDHVRPRYGNYVADIDKVNSAFSTQGYEDSQEPDSTYPRDLEFDSDEPSSNQGNPPYRGDRRW